MRTTDQQPAVLVAGAINTDLVAVLDRAPAAGETVTGTGFAIWGGGKGANQAVAAKRAGASIALLGAVGSDDFGAARLDDLRSEGIDIASVAERQGVASGVALIFVEPNGENRIAYVPGATSTVTSDEALRALDRTTPSVLLCTLELPTEALGTLVEAAHEREILVMLCATPDTELARPLLRHINLLLLNEIEAATLLGIPAEQLDAEDLLGRLRELGPKTIVLTRGKAGIIALIDDRLVRQSAIDVSVVDTTGAGDAFAGALAAALANELPTDEALRRAIVAGGLATTVEGAQPSMPNALMIDQEFMKLNQERPKAVKQ